MSAANRLFSGSAAAWVSMGVSLVSQVVLVPIFLSHWNSEVYGIWLAIQAAIGVVILLNTGHQSFLQNEFLRIGAHRIRVLRTFFWSAVTYGLLLGGLEFLVVVTVILTGTLPMLLGAESLEKSSTINAAEIVFLAEGLVSWLFIPVGGIAIRVLAPLGYYPRVAWWGVAVTCLRAAAPALVVLFFNGGLMMAGLTQVATVILINIPLSLDLWRLLKRGGLHPVRPNWRLGFRNVVLSQLLTFKSLLEMSRQQGVRLILASLAGAAPMAAFATMRTGANVALQGLSTIANPLMPELMRFLNQRDQARTEAAFGTVWLILAGAIVPAVIFLQAFIEPAFSWWTRGKIGFDPLLFGTLSAGVLVFAVARPALAVVQGNNLLRIQLILSVLAGAVAVGGMVMLVPIIGIRGAAYALFAAETVSAFGYVFSAQAWLTSQGMRWPWTAFLCVLTSVILAGCAMAGMVLYPSIKVEILGSTLMVQLILLVAYWRQLPMFARERAARLLTSRLPTRVSARLNG